MTKRELLNKFMTGDVKEGVCPYCGCNRIYMEEYDINLHRNMLTVTYTCKGCKVEFENNYRLSFSEVVAYDDEGEAVALW